MSAVLTVLRQRTQNFIRDAALLPLVLTKEVPDLLAKESTDLFETLNKLLASMIAMRLDSEADRVVAMP